MVLECTRTSVKTYDERKGSFTPFYCKRVAQEDFIHMNPLAVVTCP